MDRLEALKAIVAQSPKDVFPRYGLAMELVKAGELEQAVNEFREIMSLQPGYAAAYYHCGQTLEKLGRLDEAKQVYRKGMELTGSTGDTHTYEEIQAALALLP